MKSDSNTSLFHKILPSPFALAIILTFLSFVLALGLTQNPNPNDNYLISVLGFWQKGFWELLTFAMQMMLMLVLGNVLALTPIFKGFISWVIKFANTTSSAVVLVALVSLVLAYFNWGLSLILSALLAQQIGAKAKVNQQKLNYPLIGAAAYSGLMVWHGGFSGSAPLKVAEKGHFLYDQIGQISITQTILSPMNISVVIATLVLIPLTFWILSRKKSGLSYDLNSIEFDNLENEKEMEQTVGAEQIDVRRCFSLAFGLLMIVAVVLGFWQKQGLSGLNINSINMLLFALSLILYPNLRSFSKSVSSSIASSSGIMLQFPLYAGIMGVMKYSGLTMVFTDFFIQISTPDTFPLMSMLSAGIVNFFVPSGGGQWAVQGPILMEAAQSLHVGIPKTIMALAYGDELTNMLQPFWALPLLGITKLKARDILPYSAIILLLGIMIFSLALLVF
jgi:short-chain fatty acids transporter